MISNNDAKYLLGLKVVVVGYGSQGRGQSLNLRDSGVNVKVALRKGGESWTQAESEGWNPIPLEEAATDADLICLLVPDMVQEELFQRFLFKKMKKNATLLFSHGLAIHQNFIKPDPDNNVVMVAPKGPGFLVRREFEQGAGVPCLMAVENDATGNAWEITEQYAGAIGGARAGLIETTFKEETETDLFGEQAVLCGGVSELVIAAWETLVQAGYQKEIAYFECLHELKLIVDLLYEGGFSKMHQFISDTASYGALVSGPRVVDQSVRQKLKAVLEDIQSGKFSRKWKSEHENGGVNFAELVTDAKNHPIESIGKDLRSKFRWINEPETPKEQQKQGAC